jgi:membrane protein DedA with SNARE-associated domain
MTLISLILAYRYWILFPLACLEGPILALVIGFLVHLGYFDILPAFLLMCAGDFFPDNIYYYLGRIGQQKNFLEKYGTRLKFVTDNFAMIEKLWKDHSLKMMFLSKLAYGLSTPLLISAGLAKMPFRKFVTQAFIVTLFQYGVILTLGYYLGYSYVYAAKYIKLVSVILALVLVIFIFTYVNIQKYAKRQLKKLEEAEEKSNI